MMKLDIYETVTNRILFELEKGAAPWVKPWKSNNDLFSMPYNGKSKNQYNGINVLLLWLSQHENKFTSNEFMTFRQAKELGGMVRKGEKGTMIVYVGKGESKTEIRENGDPKTFTFMKKSFVFNIEQIDDLKHVENIDDRPLVERINDAEAFIKAQGAVINHTGDNAFYSTKTDEITLPNIQAFAGSEGYYATSLHEHAHRTGHKSRLNRDLNGRFGTESYAAEELIAELSSAFLCAQLNIQGDLRHAGYLKHWLRLLKTDKKAIFTAASMASKAAQYMTQNAEATNIKEAA